MERLDLFYKILAFFANSSLTFRVFEIGGIWRVYASYIVCKKLVLYVKPLFLLGKLVEACCNFLCCHYFLFNKVSNFFSLYAQNPSK